MQIRNAFRRKPPEKCPEPLGKDKRLTLRVGGDSRSYGSVADKEEYAGVCPGDVSFMYGYGSAVSEVSQHGGLNWALLQGGRRSIIDAAACYSKAPKGIFLSTPNATLIAHNIYNIYILQK